MLVVAGCSGFSTVSDRAGGGDTFIELDVEPSDATIFIDDEYMGTVDGWHHRMVPVEPGVRRLKIDADGHIAQRLDVDIDRGRTVTVRARLQPAITTPDGEQIDDDAPPRQSDQSPGGDDEDENNNDSGPVPPAHPTAPD